MINAWNHLDLTGKDGGPTSYSRLVPVAASASISDAEKNWWRRRDDDDELKIKRRASENGGGDQDWEA